MDQHLENAMDIVEKAEHISLRKATMYWNIPLTSFSNHLNGRTKRRKVGPRGVLTKQKDVAIVTWVLNMQIVRLSITIQ
jgi:hypothetical protein